MARSAWACNRRDWFKKATAAVAGITAPWWSSVASAADEATLWQAQKATAEAAFAFWERFLAFRKGAANDQPLDGACRSQFLCIIRAVSWVEAKHGTAGVQQPAR